jgi:hypothetical protein
MTANDGGFPTTSRSRRYTPRAGPPWLGCHRRTCSRLSWDARFPDLSDQRVAYHRPADHRAGHRHGAAHRTGHPAVGDGQAVAGWLLLFGALAFVMTYIYLDAGGSTRRAGRSGVRPYG